MPRVRVTAARLAVGAAWAALAALVAVGAAALVVGSDHQPGSAAREELTWAADRSVGRRLDAIVANLDALSVDVAALGRQGRAALAATVGSDSLALGPALASGDQLVGRIAAEANQLDGELGALPEIGRPEAGLFLDRPTLDRVATAVGAVDATRDLAEHWAILSGGCQAADRLAGLLRSHDAFSGEAARLGSQARYAEALAQLDQAGQQLAGATALRDRAANTADVAVLTQWLGRNAAIDAALRRLYAILVTTNGRLDADAARALADVTAARQQLPRDTRALVVIMADLARAGPDQAAIAIEEARARLAATVAVLRRTPGG